MCADFKSPHWVIISLLMSANTCVFIPRQLNLDSACWLLVSYYFCLIKSHGLTEALAAAFNKHSSGCGAFRVIQTLFWGCSWQHAPPMLLQDACTYLKLDLLQVCWPRDAVPPVAAERSAEKVQTENRQKKHLRYKLLRMCFTSSSRLFPNTFSNQKTWVRTSELPLCDPVTLTGRHWCVWPHWFFISFFMLLCLIFCVSGDSRDKWWLHEEHTTVNKKSNLNHLYCLNKSWKSVTGPPQETALTPCWGVSVGSVSRPRCFSLIIK